MATTVLLVEDELPVREAVSFHLERAGYEVRACATAREAWDALPGADVVVLDWMLPDEAGLNWLRRLRTSSAYANLPVLMLTARAAETDRVDGLYAGADDYVTKPFSAAELAARVRALLRRAAPEPGGVARLGDLVVDLDAGVARLRGDEIALTRREFDLLAFLSRHPGRVYSRQDLLDRVWGPDFVGGERTVDQHVTQLRSRLEDDPQSPRFIETVRGRGYRMRPADERAGA